ncbi:MAG: DUF86 domain-containing protein [Ruminococcus sp.]|nr:DUF86 domain-containing protein [Ruminococcus sp.]
MDKRDVQVLEKISDHISSVLSYCKDCSSLEDFQNDKMRVEACVFNLMQIGELAKSSLSDEAKSQIKTIPWNQIYGMRNRIVHGYSGVNMQIVWDTINNDLEPLLKEIRTFLK